jgi:DNA-binding FadR family transcriptional regulator
MAAGTTLVTFARPRLRDQVLGHMTRLVMEGAWPSGGQLPSEGDLAQELKVSRTVIRECVSILASRGMLDVRQGRTITVAPHAKWTATEPLALLVRSDHEAVLNWLEVRIMLELGSAEMAARRATQDDLDELDQLMTRLRAADDDPDRYRDSDIAFHLTIARATRNPSLVRLLQGVIQPLHEQLEERALTPLTRHVSTAEHATIVRCIMRGDAEGAREAMAAHLARVVDETRQLLEQEGRT